jgi:hypothetical protein
MDVTKRNIHDRFIIAKSVNKNNKKTSFMLKDIRKMSIVIAFWITAYVQNSL